MTPMKFLQCQDTKLESAASNPWACEEHHPVAVVAVSQPVDRSIAAVLGDSHPHTKLLFKEVRHHPSDREAPETEPVRVLGQRILSAPRVEERLEVLDEVEPASRDIRMRR